MACSGFAHIGGFATDQEIVARRRKEIDHFSIFAKPCLMFRATRNDHDIALAADSMFGAKVELSVAKSLGFVLHLDRLEEITVEDGRLLANSRPKCGVDLWLVRSADGGCHVLRERLPVL